MKLVISIVHRDDSSRVLAELSEKGFMSTKLSTTGGFLRAGNTTILTGTDDEKVDAVLAILRENCSKRTELVSATAGNFSEQFLTSVPVQVNVGGATVFVIDVEQFIKM